MIQILLDTTIIVALITFLGVVISSVLAPIIVERFNAQHRDENQEVSE